MSLEKKSTVVLGILLAFSVVVVCIAHVWKSTLVVKHCTVEGNRLVSPNEIVQLMGVQRGTLLFRVNLTDVQNNVLAHYYVKHAVVKRNLPNTITVVIEERCPIAIINSSTLSYVDEEGVVLPSTVSRRILDLPLLSSLPSGENVKHGMQLSSASIREALLLLRIMKTLNRPLFHNISEVIIGEHGELKLLTTENCVPILFGRGNVEEKFVKLEAFWNQVIHVRGTTALEYIDARFADRIVARWNTPGEKSSKRL